MKYRHVACLRRWAPVVCGVLAGLAVVLFDGQFRRATPLQTRDTVSNPTVAAAIEMIDQHPQPMSHFEVSPTTASTASAPVEAPAPLPAAKAEVAPTAEPAQLTSAWKEGLSNNSCIEHGHGRSGQEVEDWSQENSAKACRKRCYCIQDCAFFTYWSNGHCHVQASSARSGGFSNNDASTGPASCVPRDLPEIPPMPAFLNVEPDASIQDTMPRVYIYELEEKFRNGGKDSDCWTADCVFGGPPENVHGVEIWSSNQFHMPRMLYYRFLNSPRRTKDLDEADVFVIPAYVFKPDPETPCVDKDLLRTTVMELNPRLKNQKYAKEKGPRHLLMDARGWETCNYMWDFEGAFRYFHRVNIELNGMLEDGPEGWTAGKPWFWYQFPYPAVYHGRVASTPARLRSRGLAQYLWSFSGTGRGLAGHLRQKIMRECNMCNRCGKVLNLAEVNGRLGQDLTIKDVTGLSDYGRMCELKLRSTFCVEPPGDTVTRKSLIDSMVLGCIPVVFLHQELDMFELFFTAEEFAKAIVFIPEAQIMGDLTYSKWATGPLDKYSKQSRELKKLYPEHAKAFDALRAEDEKKREAGLRQLYLKPTKLVNLLSSISVEEIKSKQAALADIAPRLIIGLDDSDRDAVRILLEKIVSNDEAVLQREARSSLK